MEQKTFKNLSNEYKKYLSEIENILINYKLEEKYTQFWKANFKTRLAMGRFLSRLLVHEKLSAFVMQLLIIFPFILTFIIKKTHGKPLIIKS